METTVEVPVVRQQAAAPKSAAPAVQPAAKEAPAPRQEAAPASSAAAGNGVPQEDAFADWDRVVALAAQQDIPLGSFLLGSRAYRKGNRVLIDGNKMLYD